MSVELTDRMCATASSQFWALEHTLALLLIMIVALFMPFMSIQAAYLDRVLRGQLAVVSGMGSGRWGWIVPDGLWEIAQPLLPPARVRPQGGGVANIDDEAVFEAIIYVLVNGCAWRALPPCLGASRSTVHRRFVIWSRAGVWGRLHQKILELLMSRT